MAELDVKLKYADIKLNLNGVKYEISQAFEFPEQNLSVKESSNGSRKKTILFGDIPTDNNINLEFKEIASGGNGAIYKIGDYAVKVEKNGASIEDEAKGIYNFGENIKNAKKKKYFPKIYGYGILTKVDEGFDKGDQAYFYSMEMIKGIKLTEAMLEADNGSNAKQADEIEFEKFVKEQRERQIRVNFPALEGNFTVDNVSNSPSEIKLDTREKVMEVFTQICDAIKCIHDAERFHGDLKPDNIMIDEGNNIKIIDMSCIEVGKHTDEPCQKLCTLAYISPERSVVLGGQKLQGDSLNILKQSDIWVLGIILVNLITQYDFIRSSKKEPMGVAFKIYKLSEENYTFDDYFNIFGYEFTKDKIIIKDLNNDNMVKLVKDIFTKNEEQIKTIDALIDRFNAVIENKKSGDNSGSQARGNDAIGDKAGAVTGGPNLPVNVGGIGQGGSSQGGGRKKRISKKKGRYSKKKKVRYSKKKKINSKRKRRS